MQQKKAITSCKHRLPQPAPKLSVETTIVDSHVIEREMSISVLKSYISDLTTEIRHLNEKVIDVRQKMLYFDVATERKFSSERIARMYDRVCLVLLAEILFLVMTKVEGLF
jgi:hypothetical protein